MNYGRSQGGRREGRVAARLVVGRAWRVLVNVIDTPLLHFSNSNFVEFPALEAFWNS